MTRKSKLFAQTSENDCERHIWSLFGVVGLKSVLFHNTKSINVFPRKPKWNLRKGEKTLLKTNMSFHLPIVWNPKSSFQNLCRTSLQTGSTFAVSSFQSFSSCGLLCLLSNFKIKQEIRSQLLRLVVERSILSFLHHSKAINWNTCLILLWKYCVILF